MPPRYKRSRPASSVAARKRPTARSSTAPQPPSPPALPFEFASSEQQERYTKLTLRPILPNRFIDEAALAQVDIRDIVLEPLRRIGRGEFLDMKDLVYAPFTLEFLSSYSSFIRFLPTSPPSKIRFRLLSRDFELSVNEEGGRGTRLDLDVMIHMKLIEKVGDAYRIVGTPAVASDDAGAEAAGGANMEEDIPPPFTSSFGADPGCGSLASSMLQSYAHIPDGTHSIHQPCSSLATGWREALLPKA
ncbi:hypothetical protein JCGZ_06035 [Jatropha curcas]|uniref:Uncharacterized protein n=1 Tax=Jatropha curcas TaxID=180498 RepID=A0A067LFE2_JATCU|nr:hypothetical protein JCGZ_06035 [Jatropha curcas]